MATAIEGWSRDDNFESKIDTVSRATGFTGELNMEWKKSDKLKIEF